MIVTLIVIIAGMILLEGLCLKVEVVDVPARAAAGLPLIGQRRLQTLLSNVEQIPILFHVHSEILGILLDFLLGWLIFLVKFFLHDLKTLP